MFAFWIMGIFMDDNMTELHILKRSSIRDALIFIPSVENG
jgi:hypothetical protein